MFAVARTGSADWKMLRPTEAPIAPARIAWSMISSSCASAIRGPPATITGLVTAARIDAKPSAVPGQLVLMMSAPSSSATGKLDAGS